MAAISRELSTSFKSQRQTRVAPCQNPSFSVRKVLVRGGSQLFYLGTGKLVMPPMTSSLFVDISFIGGCLSHFFDH